AHALSAGAVARLVAPAAAARALPRLPPPRGAAPAAGQPRFGRRLGNPGRRGGRGLRGPARVSVGRPHAARGLEESRGRAGLAYQDLRRTGRAPGVARLVRAARPGYGGAPEPAVPLGAAGGAARL